MKPVFGILFFLLLFPVVVSFGQLQNAVEFYSRKDNAVIDTVVRRIKNGLKMHNRHANEIIQKRIDYVEWLFLNDKVIKHAALEEYVTKILERINRDDVLTPLVFIIMDDNVNAYTIGNSLYFINVGLIGRMYNEQQIGFVLAHEIAHYQLDHSEKQIEQYIESKYDNKSSKQLKKILFANATLENIEALKELWHNIGKFNQSQEFSADSLGMQLFTKAGYNKKCAFEALDILWHHDSVKFNVGADLVMPLHSKQYPLQPYWFNERLSIYSKGYQNDFLFHRDSVQTHPGMKNRIVRLQGISISPNISSPLIYPEKEAIQLHELAEFMTMDAAYYTLSFDKSLFYALQLLNRFPDHPYLIKRISTILVNLRSIDDRNDFNRRVPKFTRGYSQELKLINNFLQNLTPKELGEVAFFFMHNNGEQLQQDKKFLHLYWKICKLTGRIEKSDEIRLMFSQRFGEKIENVK